MNNDIAEILLKLALNTINQSINQSIFMNTHDRWLHLIRRNNQFVRHTYNVHQHIHHHHTWTHCFYI